MQCENCGQRPAAVHQTLIVNGDKQESHLCEVCAQEQNHGTMNFPFPNISMQQLLSSFLGHDPPAGGTAMVPRPQKEPTCPNCGLKYSEFAATGNLGCAECYDHFERQLVPLIKRIHGNTTHGGKSPKRKGGGVRQRRELDALRKQLHEAIDAEDYEGAARLRDALRTLETEVAGGEGGAVE